MKEEEKSRAETIQEAAAARLKEEKKRNSVLTCIRLSVLAAVVILVIAAANHGQSELPGPVVSTESIAKQAEKSPTDEKEPTNGSKKEETEKNSKP